MKLLQADLYGPTKMGGGTIKSNKLNSSNQPHGLPSLDFLIYCCLIAFVVGHIIFVFPIVFSFSFEVWGIHNIITTALCYKML